MRILQNQGRYTIFQPKDNLCDQLRLTEEFGRTCYQSYECKACNNTGEIQNNVLGTNPGAEKFLCPKCNGTGKRTISNESAIKFFKMIEKRGHESVFEHIPIVFEMEIPWDKAYIDKDWNSEEIWQELATAMNYIVGLHFSRETNDQRLVTTWTFSMNLRTLRDWVMAPCNSVLSRFIYGCILEACPTMVEGLSPEKIVTCGWGEGFNYQLLSQTDVLAHPDTWYREMHGYMTVRFSDVSRGFTHELVRHRLCAFSQESTRYVDEKESAIVAPPEISVDEGWGLQQKHTHPSFRELGNNAFAAYQSLQKRGWPKEDARQILPIGLANEIVCTANLKEWIWIMKMRTSHTAHWEIRFMMIQVLQELQKLYPGLFNSFVIDGHDKKGIPHYQYQE